MSNTWIVVAESSRARIFQQQRKGGQLEELADLVHPESRLKNSARLSDAPGRSFDSQGRGKHAMNPATEPRRHEGEVFARALAQQLESGRTSRKFGALILAAPPAFLGLLRSALQPETSALVGKTLNKNMVKMKAADIREVLAS